MFKIKRKLIIAASLSAALLSGCAQKGKEPVHIPLSGVVGGASAQSSVQASAPKQSTVQQQSVPQSSASSESVPQPSVPPESVSADEPPEQSKTIVYNNDPENACSITFDGERITVKGKYGDLFGGVVDIYPEMDIESSLDGDTLTCVLTPVTTRFDRDFGSFAILDVNRCRNTVHIDLSNGGVEFPDTSALVQFSQRAADAAVAAPEYKVAQYITLDGSRGKIPQILDEIKRISDEICGGIDSDYEKLRAISRWVSDNIYYDHPAYSSGAPRECLSLEYMLNNRASICGGYSNMTSALCAAQGIRCLNISGMAINNGNCYLQNERGEFHEWNVAEIDGRQIIVDSGWNSRNDFNYDGTFSAEPSCYKYFDISADVFVLDHKAQSAEYRDYWALV